MSDAYGGGFGQGSGGGGNPPWNAPYPGAPLPGGPAMGGGPLPPSTGGPGPEPWADPSLGFLARWWGTVKGVTFSPRQFYAAAAQSEDVWPPIKFSVINGTLIGLAFGLFVALIYVVGGGVGALSAAAGGGSSGPAAAMFGIMAALGIGVAILYPIQFAFAGFVGPWINGGVHHLVLMLLRGANAPYIKTVRVTAYAMASQFWFVVPCLGPLAAIAVHFIANAVGLDEVHKCGLGKAVAALIAVPAICICLYLALFMVGFASGMAPHHH